MVMSVLECVFLNAFNEDERLNDDDEDEVKRVEKNVTFMCYKD